MVHLSTHCGEASNWSISLARLLTVVSFTKLSTALAVGMRPVRSSVTRRTNSQSVVMGAGVTPLACQAA